ncbi:MAG: hypothetical protein K5679_01155 [Lachnospiraceae bacterium]|nr:hypothetical protein [Lachnospiraceae bacterium]
MIDITRRDIINALRKINFLERNEALSKQFNKGIFEIAPQIDKKRVDEIISKLGYIPGRKGNYFWLKNQMIGNITIDVCFSVKSYALYYSWEIHNEGEFVDGGPIIQFLRVLSGNGDYVGRNALFRTDEELEEILAIMFKMFEDFKQALCEVKGIEINEN